MAEAAVTEFDNPHLQGNNKPVYEEIRRYQR